MPPPIPTGIRYPGSKHNDFHFLDGMNNAVGRSEQNGSITWDELMEWFGIVYPSLRKGTFAIHKCQDHNPQDLAKSRFHMGPAIDLQKSKYSLVTGDTWYVILGLDGEYIKVEATREIPPLRVEPGTHTPNDIRFQYFWEAVRYRDRKCVLTGACIKITGGGHSNRGASLWNTKGWQNRLVDDTEEVVMGKTKICSMQNAILMDSTYISAFTKNKIAINPEKGYKITCFRTEGTSYTLDGKLAHIPSINSRTPQDSRVSDELLYHHYKESVIINMTGRWGYDELPDYDEWCDMCVNKVDKFTKKATELYFAKALVLDIDRSEPITIYDLIEVEFAVRGFVGYTDDDLYTNND
ncbi:hypothetical protein TWF481_003014 [Arthrobotrys musiformis]|uniref:HNH nuclease domain-containing protein n=1 Tax=Arthrobotrys musiformis TaxID=47236 RepID=A0AAV9VS19_9PEZI